MKLARCFVAVGTEKQKYAVADDEENTQAFMRMVGRGFADAHNVRR